MKAKTQTIKRKALAEIHSSVCAKWQKRIFEHVVAQTGDTIEVVNNLISEAYEEADSAQKKFISKHFEIISDKITDRIKTFQNILDDLGLEESDVVPFAKPKNKNQRSLNAFAKIQLISEILNEGWTPDFNDTNQSKYFPYFRKDKSGWSVDCYYYYRYAACLGSGSYFKSSELALYAGTQFKDIYVEYLPE